MRTALTIAGSDSSGGAGIQADIKTMMAHHVFGMSAITALTAQNTTGVIDIMEVTPKFLEEELQCIFTDIYPDAVKIGMVSSAELMEVIARNLKKYNAKKIVVDPVMVATSGAKFNGRYGDCNTKKDVASDGRSSDSEYSRGRSACRDGNLHGGRYDRSCTKDQ
mgnify:CR=1 FL=1